VVVYSHRDMTQLLPQWAGHRMHRADAIEVYALDRSLVDALASRLERRMAFGLTITERHLYAAFDDATVEGALTRHAVPA